MLCAVHVRQFSKCQNHWSHLKHEGVPSQKINTDEFFIGPFAVDSMKILMSAHFVRFHKPSLINVEN